jgi:hypothetical protein
MKERFFTIHRVTTGLLIFVYAFIIIMGAQLLYIYIVTYHTDEPSVETPVVVQPSNESTAVYGKPDSVCSITITAPLETHASLIDMGILQWVAACEKEPQ